MRSLALSTLLVLAAAGAWSSGAQAVTCYVVFDRNENVIFRDTYPPVDLSDQGRADRDALRRRGEYMMSMDADRCPQVEFFTGSAGNVNVNVDKMVGGMSVERSGEATSAAPAAAPAPGSQRPRPQTAPAKPKAPGSY